jgi:hypothetical protein
MSPREIEQALQADRQAIAASLAALRDRLQPSALLADGKAALRSQAAPLLGHLDAAVRAQPLAAAIAGVALAALVLGRHRAAAPDPTPALAGTRFEALTRWEDEGGPPMPEPVDPDEDWLSDAMGLRARAAELLARIDDAARRRLAPAAELAAHRAAVTAALARDTAATLGRGLETLTGSARDTALAARERLYLRRVALADRAQRTVADHPLAAGLALAALGAATACLFPQTETEDRLLGEARDRLVDDARRALRDEALRTSALARSLTSALKSDLAAARSLVTPAADAPQPAWHH